MSLAERIVCNQLLDPAGENVPYKALLAVYRDKLQHEFDTEKRVELEFKIVQLLGFIELQRELEAIKLRLSREG